MSTRNGTPDRRSNPATTTRTVHVDEVNEWGIRVDGKWLNYSKWAKDVDPVVPGLDVEIHQDSSGFIRTLSVLGSGLTDEEPVVDRARPPLAPTLLTKDVQIIRQTCLKVSATFCAAHPELKSSEMLALAERLEAWVLR